MFDFITGLIGQAGYLGIFALMLVENVFPPIPSELIMPLAGFNAAQGRLNVVLVVLSGTLGSVAGALPWYYAGKLIGIGRLRDWSGRHGRWLTLTPEEVDVAQDRFKRHGAVAVFLGRLVPAVRTLISVPAGVAEMPMPVFLLFTALGSLLWTAALAGAGYLLESQYERVAEFLNPVTNVVVGLIVIVYIYRVITFRPRSAE